LNGIKRAQACDSIFGKHRLGGAYQVTVYRDGLKTVDVCGETVNQQLALSLREVVAPYILPDGGCEFYLAEFANDETFWVLGGNLSFQLL
jgi:hypothetical protein